MNGRITKLFILMCCIVFLCAIFIMSAGVEKHQDVQFASLSEYDLLCASLTKTDSVPLSGGYLMIEGNRAPFDKASNCYYISQSLLTDGIDGNLTWSGANQSAVMCLDDSFPDKEEAIQEGRTYQLMIHDSSHYYTMRVVFTSIPIISISMESDNSTFEWDSTAIASVIIFDPDRDGADGYGVDTAQAKLTLRGTSSINYDKKSYNMTLYDELGTRNGFSLFGMEKSDRWILKSLMMDPFRTRECVASGIWNSICATNPDVNVETSDFRYAEVFLDDAYYGLFGIMTKIVPQDCITNEKTDVVFKAQSYDFLYYKDEDFQLPLFRDSGIRFPETWREGVYDPIYWYVDALYSRESDITYEDIKAHMEMDNIIDYALFYMLVSARDNNFTNTIYLFQYDGSNYKTTLIPWDMDMTFGNSWDTVWTGAPLPLSETETVLIPQEIRVMLSYSPDEINELLSERWFALRESVLSDETLHARIAQAFNQLEESGAICREEALWTQPGVQRGADYMMEYILQRASFMDRYFSQSKG